MNAELKHILIALHRFEAGGAERQALYLSKGLVKKGFKVTVIAFGSGSGLGWDRFVSAGVNLEATGFLEKLILNPKGITGYFLKWKYRRKLIALGRRIKPDFILPFTYPPNIIFGDLWKKMNARACYWNQRDEGRQFLGKAWEIDALENCSGVISNSLEGKNFLTKHVNLPVTIIHNGVEEFTLNKVSEVNEKIKVVMVANIHSYKDHTTLLKAWRIVISKIGSEKTELILAGREGQTAFKLKEFVSENHLQDSVRFAGQIVDVPGLLATCQIGVFSSVNEGVPNGILECMAAGLPIVATRISGSEEALGTEYPFLSAPQDAEDMAEKLWQLIEDFSLRERIGIQNKLIVLKNFGIERMVEQYIAIIDSNNGNSVR